MGERNRIGHHSLIAERLSSGLAWHELAEKPVGLFNRTWLRPNDFGECEPVRVDKRLVDRVLGRASPLYDAIGPKRDFGSDLNLPSDPARKRTVQNEGG